MYVLGLDPGNHTGFSLVDFGGSLPRIDLTTTLELPAGEVVAAVDDLLAKQSVTPVLVAMEEFRIVPGMGQKFSGSDMFTTQIIGAMKSRFPDVLMVQPSQRRWWDKKKLGMVGIDQRFGSPHARDATFIAFHGAYFGGRSVSNFTDAVKTFRAGAVRP